MHRRIWIVFVCVPLLCMVTGCGQTEMSQPTMTPIPGWEKFEGDDVELWLPESFNGGDLSNDLDVVVENLRRLGPDFEAMADMIEQNPSAFVIWAFDSKVGYSGFLTNVNITTERMLSAVSIETYLDAVTNQLPPQFQVVEREPVSLERYEAARLFVEFSISGVRGKEILYLIKDGKTMWGITFATGADEFNQRLPIFEQSILTFRSHR